MCSFAERFCLRGLGSWGQTADAIIRRLDRGEGLRGSQQAAPAPHLRAPPQALSSIRPAWRCASPRARGSREQAGPQGAFYSPVPRVPSRRGFLFVRSESLGQGEGHTRLCGPGQVVTLCPLHTDAHAEGAHPLPTPPRVSAHPSVASAARLRTRPLAMAPWAQPLPSEALQITATWSGPRDPCRAQGDPRERLPHAQLPTQRRALGHLQYEDGECVNG